jgi:hypothetical protein
MAKVIKAELIKTDGTRQEVEIKSDVKSFLSSCQKYVEGYIEIVRTKDNKTLIVNEEGLLIGLAVNLIATRMYDSYTPIVGNVLLFNMSKEELAERGL